MSGTFSVYPLFQVIFEDRSKNKIKAQVNGLGFAFCGYGNVYMLSFWHFGKKLCYLLSMFNF